MLNATLLTSFQPGIVTRGDANSRRVGSGISRNIRHVRQPIKIPGNICRAPMGVCVYVLQICILLLLMGQTIKRPDAVTDRL